MSQFVTLEPKSTPQCAIEPNGKTVFIRTYGCQMNTYDSDKIIELLRQSHGFLPTEDETAADLLLLNTCSIREKAQEKVFSQLGRWRKLKDKNPNIKIGVGGCVASQEGKDIRIRAPYVDLVFGPQTLHRLPNMLNQNQISHLPVVDVSFPEIEKFDQLAKPKASGVSAYVSVMEGCSKYCTFCVVPYTRGDEISRPFEDVIREIKLLVAQGVQEINLLGQNVNAYRGLNQNDDEVDLGMLIRYIAHVLGVKRIRYTTSHPLEMNDSLFQAYADVPALVSHLHLPIQSGSDVILSAMKRRHTVDEYRAIIKRLRQLRPNISLSSDFIIGFPNETENDFNDTMRLIADINFDRSFSFIYSQRPGTPAADMPDNVPLATKKTRLALMQQRLNQQFTAIGENMVGQTEVVLVESKSKHQDDYVAGRTENNRVVNFKGKTDLIGQFVPVKIIKVLTNSLRGEIV